MIERLSTHSPAATVLMMQGAPGILDLLCSTVITGTYGAVALAALVEPSKALRGDRQRAAI
jgi:hypothetical protein